MKRIRDISVGEHINDLDVSDKNISKNLDVESNEKIPLFCDISAGVKNDISIKNTHKIQVKRKQGKNFDALEKKGLFSRISNKKTITLKKKQKSSLFLNSFIMFRRKLQHSGLIGKSLLLVFFLVFLGVIGYLDKLLVEKKVNSGYQRLIAIKDGNMDFETARKEINNSRFDLLVADILFSPFAIFTGEKINSVEHVISGGRYISRSLDDILALYVKTDEFIAEKSLHRVFFTQLFSNIYPELQDIESSLEASIDHYKNISWLPSGALFTQRDQAIEEIQKMYHYLKVINKNFIEFLNIFGHSEKRRYLIVFQNADEIRPTGGFMGSMALLEIYKGNVQLFQKKDVYAIEWDLKKSSYERLQAPKGLNELTEKFGLRDANYFINLKDSSQTIKFFTDQAGIEIDGVVYINQNILLHLLEITGPVYFDAINRDITSENFSEIMSLLVEAKVFKEGTLGTPKQILFDFIEIFIQRLIDDGEYFSYIQSLIHDIDSRDIMMWSFQEAENRFLSEIGIRGDIYFDESLDYIYPVFTSLSGNKSDRYMQRKYIHTVKSGDLCSYDVNFEIQSTHNMTKTERERVESLISEYDLDSPNLFEIQGADRNRQFVRIIVPKGAKIKKKDDMDIIDYGSRQGIEFFLDTQLQETSYYDISYSLPNPDCKNYDVTLFKQSGIPSYDIEININDISYPYFQRKEDFYFEKRK